MEFKWGSMELMKMEVGSMLRVEVGSMEVWCSGSWVSGSGCGGKWGLWTGSVEVWCSGGGLSGIVV